MPYLSMPYLKILNTVLVLVKLLMFTCSPGTLAEVFDLSLLPPHKIDPVGVPFQ